MTLAHDENHLRQVYAARARDEGKRPAAALLVDSVVQRGQRDRRRALELEILEAVQDERLDDRIASKVARAVCEGRVSEHSVQRILSGLAGARQRGAYFVCSAKRMFDRNELPWHEEDWR